jgi:Beta/Gamma crystallin
MHLYKVASALVFPLLIIACGQTPDSSPVPDQTASPKLSTQVNRDDRDYVGRRDNSRLDFFKVFQGTYDSPTMCFANGGNLGVRIGDVWRIKSGNNRGYVETSKGLFSFDRYETLEFYLLGDPSGVGTVTINRIVIFNFPG